MMKRYKHSKDSTERVGFYVALSVCMVAVGLAIWSAYSTFNDYVDETDEEYFSSLTSPATVSVIEDVTGVTEPATEPTQAPTQEDTTPTEGPSRTKGFTIYETSTLPTTEDVLEDSELSSLEAVLKVADSLVYPVKSRSVIKPYSEEAVYSKTMHDYRAHPGCDFAAEEGDSVYAMCDGTIKNISVSELYGIIAEVECDGFTIYYCGLSSDLNFDKGDEVKTGDTIGTVAQVPCESDDKSHIHIEIRVDNKLIDPLSVIENNN